jgi:hypothetical protein
MNHTQRIDLLGHGGSFEEMLEHVRVDLSITTY